MPSAVLTDRPVMPQSSIFDAYLDRLTRELSFDVALSRRGRQGVEDHLLAAVAAEPGDALIEAQYRAIRNFGDPRDIASQYAALSLLKQARRVGTVVVLVIAGIFIAMKGRGAWYDMMQWGLSPDLRDIVKIGLLIDLYAFMVTLAIGVVGWAYIGSRPVSATCHAAYRDQLKRCLLLCIAAAVPLIASVVTHVILTGLRVFEARFPPSGLVPLLSMAADISLAGRHLLPLLKCIQRLRLH